MAAFTAGIFNHAMAATQSQSLMGASPLSASAAPADGSDGTSSSSTSSSTISANDFLTLLVTEMQNQDPTATTDPNEYINQLVNVNSLEQLIDINQNLSTALGTPASSSSSTVPGSSSASSATAPDGVTSSGGTASPFAAPVHVPGNLSTPDAMPAAQTVANALGGQPHTHPYARASHVAE